MKTVLLSLLAVVASFALASCGAADAAPNAAPRVPARVLTLCDAKRELTQGRVHVYQRWAIRVGTSSQDSIHEADYRNGVPVYVHNRYGRK